MKEGGKVLQLDFLNRSTPQNKEELQVVFVNDFNDDYHIEVDQDDELYQRVRMIRRRYKETYDWQVAMNLASLYFERLFVKYGGKKRFIRLFNSGLIRDYIPPHPKMKYHKRSMKMVDDGIMITKRRYNNIDIDLLMVLDDNMDAKVDTIVYADSEDPDRERANKLIANGKVSGVGRKNVSGMTVEAFENLFLARREQNFSSEADDLFNQEEFQTDITITDIRDPYYDEMVEDATFNPNEFVSHGNGGFVKRSDLGTVGNIERLAKAGWDPKRITRRFSGSKNILNITKQNEERKKKSKKKKQQASSSLILGMAGASEDHNSYGDYERAMLSFVADDVNR